MESRESKGRHKRDGKARNGGQREGKGGTENLRREEEIGKVGMGRWKKQGMRHGIKGLGEIENGGKRPEKGLGKLRAEGRDKRNRDQEEGKGTKDTKED
jgi:hypothetical protein